MRYVKVESDDTLCIVLNNYTTGRKMLNAHRRYRKDLADSVKISMRYRLSSRDARSIKQIDQIYCGLRGYGKRVRLFGVPFNRMQSIRVGSRRQTEQQLPTRSDSVQISIRSVYNGEKSVRDVISYHLGQLPDDKSAVRSDSRQPIAIYGHIGHS